MTWPEYLRRASEELLRGGELVTNEDVVNMAMGLPGGTEAFYADAEQAATQQARRAASRLLSRAGFASEDPAVATLFSTQAYDPPRALTLPQADGKVAHKAIEHCTRRDIAAHRAVLRSNIDAARTEADRFDAFADDVTAEQFDDTTTIGDVMRARRKEAA